MTLTRVKTRPVLRGTLAQASQWQSLFARQGFRVYPYQMGCMARASSTGTAVSTDGTGEFVANDYLMVCSPVEFGDGNLFAPDTSKVAKVTGVSTSDDALTLDAALVITDGDWLLNLGPDTGTTSPVYDGSRCVLYTDPAGVTANANKYVLTSQGGEFLGWIEDSSGFPTFAVVDLLVTNPSGVPQILIPVWTLGLGQNQLGTQSITGTSSSIAPTAETVYISADGVYTLESAPTIANGYDGQILRIVNVGSNAVTLQDQGTLPSSNLRLAASTVALGTRDSLILMYVSAIGDWVQIGQTDVI